MTLFFFLLSKALFNPSLVTHQIIITLGAQNSGLST